MPIALPAGFDLLAMHQAWPQRYPFLLETVATPDDRTPTDFDILFACPGETLRLTDSFTLEGARHFHRTGFLESLNAWYESGRLPARTEGSLPFHGGWFLFLGYELVREIEPVIDPPALPGFPVAFATRIPVAIVRARQTAAAWIVAEDDQDLAVQEVHRDVLALAGHTAQPARAPAPMATTPLEPAPAEFLDSVAHVRSLIAAGEVFQVNLSREWQAELLPGRSPADLYRQLRISNPAPFAGLAVLGDCGIVSSSPERLVCSRHGMVETRPIAGTRPRASLFQLEKDHLEEDQRQGLLAHPKERAEHIMLIDLERNDLGRICEAGSVEVDDFMKVESYAHVHHIVSNIRGRLRPDVLPGGVIRAVFPGGTITGCPKVRCMEIIRALEARSRGPYTGAMGYLNRDGSCDFNILIRTLVVQGRKLSFAAGSGIVADSDPERELEETRAKAKGMRLALGA